MIWCLAGSHATIILASHNRLQEGDRSEGDQQAEAHQTAPLTTALALSRCGAKAENQRCDVAHDTGVNQGTLTRLYHETVQRVELGDLKLHGMRGW